MEFLSDPLIENNKGKDKYLAYKIPRYLICCGDANNHLTHGGLPFNLLKPSIKSKIIDKGINLSPGKLKHIKLLWNFRQFLLFGKYRGFQYSEIFSISLIKKSILDPNTKINILSISPFLPHYEWSKNWNVNFYIDATTRQIFDNYGIGNGIAHSYKLKVLEREAKSYKRAQKIICRSKWAAESLRNDYKINSSKVFVVPGGANIDESILCKLSDFRILPPTTRNPLKLGFIGMDWERKGGSFLIKLAQELISLSIPVEIRIIGANPGNLPDFPFVKALGFIDKNANLIDFCNELRQWHFGTLFSKAEAFGISNRECLFLGTPVICHNVGGIASTVSNAYCGKIFDAFPTEATVAKWLKNILYPYSNYMKLRSSLQSHRYEFSWNKTIQDLEIILK